MAGTMRLNAALGACLLVIAAAMMQSAAAYSTGGQNLVPGYYDAKCYGRVETIVRQEVYNALYSDRGKGAALVRLAFHDCWVRGCDGSVLLDASQTNPYPEKVAGANIGLRAFDLIENIKAKLECMCPGVVSCADILAFAARDASCYLSNGNINYTVPSGRRDGVISRAWEADNTLPGSTFSFPDLESNFRNKNFDVEELVVLSGAHSIGVAHSDSFKDRLTAPQTQIDGRYQRALNNAVKSRPVVANDIRDESYAFKADAGYPVAPINGRDFLNNTYYHNSLDNRVLFKSDWVLRTDAFASGKLQEYKDKPSEWDADFADAMVKLSKLPAEGNYFEIRKKCSATNPQRNY